MNIIEKQNKFIKDLEEMILEECKKYNVNKDHLIINSQLPPLLGIDELLVDVKSYLKEIDPSTIRILKRDELLRNDRLMEQNSFMFIVFDLFKRELEYDVSRYINIDIPKEDME